MKTALSVLFLTLCFSSWGAAEITEGGSGIIYGKDHAFSLTAPKGWMLDNESGVDQGMHAVFYPKGSTWADSAVVIYAQSRRKDGKIQTAADQAKDVVANFHAHGDTKYKSELAKTLKTKKGAEVVIYHFQGDQWGNSEAAAYFVEGKTINWIVLNARDAKQFEKALPAFDELAKSYVFLGDKPIKE